LILTEAATEDFVPGTLTVVETCALLGIGAALDAVTAAEGCVPGALTKD
jgi:hypothetical protein